MSINSFEAKDDEDEYYYADGQNKRAIASDAKKGEEQLAYEKELEQR